MRCFVLPDAPAVVRLLDGAWVQLTPEGAWVPTDADLDELLTGDGGGVEVDVADDLGAADAVPVTEAKASPAQRAVVHDRTVALIERWEQAVEDLMVAHFARQEAVVLARLQGVKARKGTRHWRGQARVETKALNAEQIVAPGRWTVEVERDAGELFHRLFEEQAGDVTDSPFVRGAIETRVRRLMSTTESRAKRIVDVILDLDSTDADLEAIVEAVKGTYDQRQIWGAQAARTEVTGAVNEAALARGLALGAATKEWLSSRDERVRVTHTSAGGGDGQSVPIGLPFVIGGFPLMYPGDPAGPPHEVINCRCVMEFEGVEPYDPAGGPVATGGAANLQADADAVASLAPSLVPHALAGIAPLLATVATAEAARDVLPVLGVAVAAMARVSVAGAVLATRLPGALVPDAGTIGAAIALMALVRWHRAAVARAALEEAAGYAEDAARLAGDLGLPVAELTQALEDERAAVTE